MSERKAPRELVERLCAELRALEPPPGASDQSAARVWNRLAEAQNTPASGALVGCAAIRADLEAIVRGGERPSAPRQLLIEDHLQNCPACRLAMKELRAGAPAAASSPGPSRRLAFWKPAWPVAAALAAAVAVAVAIFAYRALAPMGGEAEVLAASGPIYRLDSPGGLTPWRGKRLAYGEWLRTGARADAVVRLADGSQVEVGGQSEFSVTAARRGTTLELHRGAVIVQAARQGPGRHLYVAAQGALVSVKGTVFSVAEGLRGARVAVLAGQVRVDHDGQQVLLAPGQQFASSPDLAAAPLSDAFAWSRDASHYLALLASVSSLRADLRKVPYPGLRYASPLLPLVPADTVFFAALPNLGNTLAQSYQVVQEHLQQDPALRAWWRSRRGNAGDLAATINELQSLGADLGDEVIVAADSNGGGPSGFLVLAQTNNPADLTNRLRQLKPEGHGQPRIAFVGDPAQAATIAGTDIYVWLDNGLLAASPELSPLRRLEARMAQPRGTGFAASPFYDRIAAAYQQGVSVLVAADVRSIVAQAQAEHGGGEWMQQLGVSNLAYFVATQQVSSAGTADHATLSFADARTGIASWLGPPAAMGALAYISPRPQMAVAAEIKQPSAIVGDVLGLLHAHGQPDDLQKLGFDPARLAASLGTEFAFALDGPILPTPAWKVIVEVNDPAALQQAIGQFVSAWNQQALAHGRPQLEAEESQSGGQTYTRLILPGTPAEVDYTLSGGYLLLAPRIGLLAEALRYHDANYNLARAPQFLAALPRDQEVNCSAVFYQDLAPALQSLLSLPGASGISPQQRDSLRQLGAEAPNAACAYGGRDSIRVAMNGATGPLGFGLGSLLGAPNGLDVRQLIERAVHGGN